MDPATGRFLSIDPMNAPLDGPGIPIAGTLHRYQYAFDNPVNIIDPTGKFGFSLGGISISLNIQGTLRSSSATIGRGAIQRVQNQLARIGLRSVKELKRLRQSGQIFKGKDGYEIHHLIEQRLVRNNPALRKIFNSLDDIPGVNITRAEHQVFTNAWRAVFPHSNQAGFIANPTTQQILAAAQKIYASNPGYLKAIILPLL